MASNNWDNPTLAGTHVNILNELKGRDVDAIKMIDDETPTNLPEKAKKWDDSLKVFRTWIAAAWTTLVLAVAGGGTGSNTAGGARTNLDVDSKSEVDGKIATHQAITNPHSSTPSPTVNRLVLRDASGRAQVVAPSAAGDIATKSVVDTVQTNLETHAGLANPHGAVSAPTANKLILRDAAGRAQVEDPSADKDLANKQYVLAQAGKAVTNFMTFKKVFGGDGSDGDVTISTNTTLPDSGVGIVIKQYNNLTIDVGCYLEAHTNDKIFVCLVKETHTLNGTIRMNGRGADGGAGITGDFASGNSGKAGAFGGGGGGTYGTPWVGGGGGGGGEDGNNQYGGGGDRKFSSGGCDKGRGGNGREGTVGPGGNGLNYYLTLLNPIPFFEFCTLFGGGGGSGAKGSAGTSGGGGKGGGVIWIEANSIVWGGSGQISANGVNGGGITGINAAGGGGAAGAIQIVYKSKTGSSTIVVNGGVGGGGYGGADGGAGANGVYGEFQTE